MQNDYFKLCGPTAMQLRIFGYPLIYDFKSNTSSWSTPINNR